jgi:sterol desaturase/sphingolipid hydroxylase (fatty acid hydroxylase superfamily)
MDLSDHVVSFAIDLFRLCLWLVLLMIVFVPLERIFGLHAQKVLRRSFTEDLCYYFMSGVLPKLMLFIPLTVVSAAMHHFVPSAYYMSVAFMPISLRIVLGLVVVEVGTYWGHRWSHEIPYLWGFHAVHHSAEEIDWLVNSKAHPVDMFFTRLVALIPLYLLGLAQPLANKVDIVPVVITLVGTFWGFFIHANVKWRFGWFEWLVSTPAFHHWHHTNDGPHLINKNYAALFPWVDKMFGSFYLPKHWPEKYGSDTYVSNNLAGQLIDPIVRHTSVQPVPESEAVETA